MTGTMVRRGVAAVVMGMVAVGCSTGGGKVGGEKAAYIAKADPLCAEMHAKVGTLGDDPGKEAEAVNDAYMRIKGIKAPNEDLEKDEVFIQALNNVQLALQDVDQSRQVNDQARANRALDHAKQNSQTAAKAARDYGFVECGKAL